MNEYCQTTAPIPLPELSHGVSAELQEIGCDLERALTQKDLGIVLLPRMGKVSEGFLREKFGSAAIICCDFYVQGIEHGGEEHEWGYLKNGIVNIDHHAPSEIMARTISSGAQAIFYIAENGIPSRDTLVVINHTDCDSVISAAIARGLVPPHPEFNRAVIAADHTCERNCISDILQALEPSQDLELCLSALVNILKGEPLGESCLPYLERSEAEKMIAQRAFMAGRISQAGGVSLLFVDERVESNFVKPLFPDSAVVLSAYPVPGSGDEEQLWNIKIRLGQSAPLGLTLHKLGIFSFDDKFGGRWNAGSTTRNGGTNKTPEEYLRFFAEQLEKYQG